MACIRNRISQIDDYKIDQAETDYLKLRQQLKDSIRKERSEPVLRNSTDNYGSFFGTSRPSIARRVIEEASGMQNSQLLNIDIKPIVDSLEIKFGEKSGVLKPKKIAQEIKEARDYSFLFSDDKPLVPTAEKFQTTIVSNLGVSSSKVSSQTKQPVKNLGKNVTERPSLNYEITRKKQFIEKKSECPKKIPSSSNQRRYPNDETSSTSKFQHDKKQQNSSKANEERIKDRYIQRYEEVHKPMLNSKSLVKKQIVKKKEFHQPKISKDISPKPQSSKKQPKKRVRQDKNDEDYENISSVIRKIFRYEPHKHVGVNDDHDRMEVSRFDDVQKEENRSARLARKEDAIERKKIEQEEMQEREAKKRKKNAKH